MPAAEVDRCRGRASVVLPRMVGMVDDGTAAPPMAYAAVLSQGM